MKEAEIPERRFDPSTSFGLISLSRFAKLFDNDSRRLNKKPRARARASQSRFPGGKLEKTGECNSLRIVFY